MVWSYIGELIFNMLILVGAVKMADRVVREMMGLEQSVFDTSTPLPLNLEGIWGFSFVLFSFIIVL